MEIKKDEDVRTRTLTINKKENLINFETKAQLKQTGASIITNIYLDNEDIKKLIKFLSELVE